MYICFEYTPNSFEMKYFNCSVSVVSKNKMTENIRIFIIHHKQLEMNS